MKTRLEKIKIEEIYYDYENPRIKGPLEKYEDKITPEIIHFALQNSSDDQSSSSSSFKSLMISVKANKGIIEPIKIIKRKGRYVCIDGNTRLAIYNQLSKKDGSATWKKIPCELLSDINQQDIESIRITTHLVGARPWPAYEKAKYLSHLRYNQLMDFDDLVALCGGGKTEIERYIDAFDDMNEYYRDKVEDADFKIDRFSSFVELQKQGIRQAIFQAGFGLNDFGNWIYKGNLKKNSDVRRLPKVLRDPEAREILNTGGYNSIDKADSFIDQKYKPSFDSSIKIEDANIMELSSELNKKIKNMSLDSINNIKEGER